LFLTSKEQVERYIFINNVYQTLIGISMVLHGRNSNPFYKFSSVVVCKFLCQHFKPQHASIIRLRSDSKGACLIWNGGFKINRH